MKLSRRIATFALSSAIVTTGALGTAVLVEACGGGSDSTTGKRVLLHTRVELEANALAFTTALGWNVTLSQAAVAGGPLYYFDGTPPLAAADGSNGTLQLAERLLGLSIARAHPGHYTAGNALGQMLQAWSADLLAGPLQLPDGDGVSGVYRSARFSFSSPPMGTAAAALAGHVALVRGRAEMADAEPRVFLAIADLSDIEKSVAEGQINGCQFREIDVQSNGTVRVKLNPQVWFDLVDFSQVEPGSADSPSTFPPDSQPFIAFAQGLAELSAYEFSFQPE